MENKNEMDDMIGVAMWGTKVIMIGQDNTTTLEYDSKETAMKKYTQYANFISMKKSEINN